MNNVELAIIIPAYKAKYFRESIESLRKQTRKDFNIYIGDDNSPDNLKSIIDEFNDLPIVYHRYSDNLGSKDLVGQWNRCVELSKSEKWIWLFSDDDIMDSNCVEKFYEIKKICHVDVFRFNTTVIDGNGKSGKPSAIGPDYESSESMAYHILIGKRGNTMPDHIFSRKVYESNGGFVNTDFGQSADWATSILFSKENGIQIIPDAILYWRRSDVNITKNAYKNRDKTIKGYFQFIKWLVKHFQYLRYNNSEISYDQMLKALRANFLMVVTNHYRGLSMKHINETIWLMRRALELSWIQCALYIFKIYSKTGPIITIGVKVKKIFRLFI